MELEVEIALDDEMMDGLMCMWLRGLYVAVRGVRMWSLVGLRIISLEATVVLEGIVPLRL